MLIMPTLLKKASKEEVHLLYTNSQNWHYFPLLAVFITDYKEQVTLIGIKSGYKYLTYHIHTNKQHNLTTTI